MRPPFISRFILILLQFHKLEQDMQMNKIKKKKKRSHQYNQIFAKKSMPKAIHEFRQYLIAMLMIIYSD